MSLSLAKLDKLNITFSTSGTTAASAEIPILTSGWIKTCIATMPSMSAAGISGTLYLYNSDDDRIQLLATNTLTASSTTVLSGMEWPLDAKDVIELRLTNIPGSAAGVSATPLTASITFYVVP